MKFDVYIMDELPSLPVNWDKPQTPTEEQIASAFGHLPEVNDPKEWKLYILSSQYEIQTVQGILRYPAGTAVLNDGYEVVYLECSSPGICGQHT